MALDSVSDFVDSLRHVRLLEPDQQNALAGELLPRFADPKALAGELIRRGWLTSYQTDLLLQGRGDELMLGSYVLLERIGEGGMGQVFKAKNWKLGRIVAFKLIRKERLVNEDAVRRFHREIRAAAQLSHPNIVMAYDADEVHGTHFFAMEYVEGADLAQLVKQHGPAPVTQACDWIHQAALGLQHAHERGLVHRDIKPHNLLLTKQGAVKILDMGLARLTHAGEDGEVSTTMTQEGAVMGTPDYMAPEQAEESHTVDIRADLYSLGCTLYQLLTGKVPFPGGTLIQKLKKHQSEQPAPLEMLRPDVPPAVADIVYKLMAKQPHERYQTPAELVRALETLPSEEGRTLPGAKQSGANRIVGEPTVNEVLDFRPTGETVQAMKEEQRSRRQAENRTLRLAAVGGGILLLGLAAALGLLLRPMDRPQPLSQPVAVEQPKPQEQEERAFEQWLRDVAVMPAEEQVKAVIAELQKRNPGFDGKVKYQIRDGTVTLLDARSNDITDLAPIRVLSGLKTLYVGGNMYPTRSKLADLTPLKGMSLVHLRCGESSVRKLEPLEGMPLLTLACNHSNVSDLSPLRGMHLTILHCNATEVSDLSPLKGMPLTNFVCHGTTVADLSVLKGMPLVIFDCRWSQVTDLSPVRDSPLELIDSDFHPYRDPEILRSIKTLKKINGKPVAEFWKEVDAQQAAFAAWCKQVAAMPAEKQVQAVAGELKRRNTHFDGKVTHKIEGGVVTTLWFASDEVTDLQPVRALKQLTYLDCRGSRATGGNGVGKLTDLSPLKELPLRSLYCGLTLVADLTPLQGMPLETLFCHDCPIRDLSALAGLHLKELHCGSTDIADLSPLKGMPLNRLVCAWTKVADLSPLKGMPLIKLVCSGTRVTDLSPLKGLPLTLLNCHSTPIADLSPLHGMPLHALYIHRTRVVDLAPLKGLPLTVVRCDFQPERDTAILRSIKTLKQINGKPAAEFWKDVETQHSAFEAWCQQVADMPAKQQVAAVAAELKKYNPGFDGKVDHQIKDDVVTSVRFVSDEVTDLNPLRVLKKLQAVDCRGSKARGGTGIGKLTDLSPLKGLPLRWLFCDCSAVSDLTPLRGMSVEFFSCGECPVHDLSPVKDLPLKWLICHQTAIADLSPLKGKKGFYYLACHHTRVNDLSPLAGLSLNYLDCQYTEVADLAPLKGAPLKKLVCDPKTAREATILRSIKTLETINGKPAAEFWKNIGDSPKP